MELKIKNGDYVLDGNSAEVLEGSAELIQRVLFKLTARREGFPFLPELGSELYRLSAAAPRERQSAVETAVRQALQDEEELEVTDAAVRPAEGGLFDLRVELRWHGKTMEVHTAIQ